MLLQGKDNTFIGSNPIPSANKETIMTNVIELEEKLVMTCLKCGNEELEVELESVKPLVIKRISCNNCEGSCIEVNLEVDNVDIEHVELPEVDFEL